MSRLPINTKFFDARKGGDQQAVSIRSSLKAARRNGNLDLSNKKLSICPEDVFIMPETLDDDEKFWEINVIVKIDLSYNLLCDIPDLFDQTLTSSLQVFKIRDNRLQFLPKTLFACERLKLLDGSINQLSDLDDNIGQLIDLKECLLYENKIQNIPESISNCRCLQILDIHDNLLQSLPSTFYLSHILHLNMKHNRLKYLPDTITEMISIESLDISENEFITIPSLSKLSKLKYLNLTQNKLTQFPILPDHQSILDRLYLGHNKLSQIDMQSLSTVVSSLTELLIHDNQLTVIPFEIGICNTLKVFDISNNSITDIPSSVGYMSSLQRFQCEGNPIRTIRRALLTQSTEDLKKYLRTRGGPAESIPRAGNSTNTDNTHYISDSNSNSGTCNINNEMLLLRVREVNPSSGILDLSSMSLTQIPITTICDMLHQRHLSDHQILQLKLSDNQLQYRDVNTNTIDKSVISSVSSNDYDIDIRIFTKLQALYMNKCLLPSDTTTTTHKTRLPPKASSRSILQNTTLASSSTSSHISSTSSTTISMPTIYLPTSIKLLDLSMNSLTTIAIESLTYTLTQIVELNLSNNLLTEIPQTIMKMTQLRELRLSHNQIMHMNNIDFSMLILLEVIDMSDNKLESIDSLTSANPQTMKSISVNNNNITVIPYQFGFFSKLNYLGCTGNPQKAIRSSIIHNTEAILEYLRMKAPINHNTYKGSQKDNQNNYTDSFRNDVNNSSLTSYNTNNNSYEGKYTNNESKDVYSTQRVNRNQRHDDSVTYSDLTQGSTNMTHSTVLTRHRYTAISDTKNDSRNAGMNYDTVSSSSGFQRSQQKSQSLPVYSSSANTPSIPPSMSSIEQSKDDSREQEITLLTTQLKRIELEYDHPSTTTTRKMQLRTELASTRGRLNSLT